jgi:hypothetical protein
MFPRDELGVFCVFIRSNHRLLIKNETLAISGIKVQVIMKQFEESFFG